VFVNFPVLAKTTRIIYNFHDCPSRSWLNGIPKKLKPLVLVGAAALCWSVWLCRNTVIFDNKQFSFLQVIFSTMHWLRTWAILQWPSFQEVLVETSLFWLRWPRYFLLGHMGGSLVLGLTAIRVSGLLSSSFRLWAVPAEIGNISRWCIFSMYLF